MVTSIKKRWLCRCILATVCCVPLLLFADDESDNVHVVQIGVSEAKKNDSQSNIVTSYNSEELKVFVYSSELALVSDVRKLKLKSGQNIIEILNVSPNLEVKSVSISCNKCPCAAKVLSYEFISRAASKTDIFKSTIGKRISFINSVGSESAGELVDIFVDENTKNDIAIIQNGSRTEFIEASKCISVFGAGQLGKRNVLRAHMCSSEDSEVELNISYLTKGVSWTPECSICVDQSMSVADISASGTLRNSTNWNIENAHVVFEYAAPSLSEQYEQHAESLLSFTYPERISLRHSSSAVVAISSISNINLNHSYLVKIPDIKNGGGSLPVYNLISIDDDKIGNFVKLNNSAFVYIKTDLGKKFLGQQNTKFMTGVNDRGLSFSVGKTNDVTATVKHIEVRNITEKMYETSIAIRVNNHKDVAVSAFISSDRKLGEECQLQKESETRANPKILQWHMLLEPNSSRDLYYKIRITKK